MIQTFTTTLTGKKQMTTDTWQFHFSLTEPKKLEFVAGQYMLLKIPPDFVTDFVERFVNPQLKVRGVMSTGEATRQYSICSAPTITDSFELLVQIVPQGIGSSYFTSLSQGSSVMFQGPAGVFTLKETPKDKIFLATGTGIAPIRSMLWDILPKKDHREEGRYLLFWVLRRSSDVYYIEEFRKLSETHKDFSFRICLSQQEDFAGLDAQCFGFGRIDKHLVNFLDPEARYSREQKDMLMEYHNQFEYYICGGDAVVESMRQFVISLGVDKKNVFFEKFV